MTYKQRRKTQKMKWPYIAGTGIVVIIVGGLLLFYKLHAHTTFQPTGPETKGETSLLDKKSDRTTNDTSNTGNSSGGQSKNGSSGDTSNATLVTPTGNFISDHHPNLSGSPAPNQMASDCTTTPAASCQITFTMNGTTKSLPAKTTDAQGSAYWNWTLQSIGLTAGTWTVKAVATLNGSASVATDARGLVVAP